MPGDCIMPIEIVQGLLIPLAGTSLGAACVFFIRGGLNRKLERAFTGFAAGVMVAASVWSLLIPAMEQSARLGKYTFFPAFAGFWAEGPEIPLSRTAKMVLAVTLHNIPEGMAVGVVYAGMLAAGTEASSAGITPAGALGLSLGIAIQNFPEGAIISLPLRAEGLKDSKAFLYGVLSGVVEPAGGFLTILAVGYVTPFLPYFLSFAAGAMLYVVVEELIPEMGRGEHSHVGTLSFAAGFSLMMVLDVAL